jgi:hypothetical protein
MKRLTLYVLSGISVAALIAWLVLWIARWP